MEEPMKVDCERTFAGLCGFALAGFMAIRLWRWFSSMNSYDTVWGAIAGRSFFYGRYRWDYGLWELVPDGQLAALANIILVVTLIAGSLLNWRWLYLIAGGVILCGYMTNAYLMVKLMATY